MFELGALGSESETSIKTATFIAGEWHEEIIETVYRLSGVVARPSTLKFDVNSLKNSKTTLNFYFFIFLTALPACKNGIRAYVYHSKIINILFLSSR